MSEAVGLEGPAPGTGPRGRAPVSTYDRQGYVVVPDVLGPESSAPT